MNFLSDIALPVIQDTNNLLYGNKDALGDISKNFNTSNSFNPLVLILVLIAMGHVIAIIFYVRWRRQLNSQPNRSLLLRQLSERLEIAPKDSRILARISREAEFEPTAALVSADLLEILTDRWQEKFGPLSSSDQNALSRVRRAVRAAIIA